MGDDLEERLRSSARAFEGLMSLIPAKEYYGKDESITSTQWQKTKKQTREERRAAKRAKLDPANHKSALDVMNENALKRKRELEGDDSSDIDIGVEKETPLQGMRAPGNKTKKQKTQPEGKQQTKVGTLPKVEDADETQDTRAKARADRKKQKLEKKKEKLAKKQDKQKQRKAQQEEYKVELGDTLGQATHDDTDDDDDDETEPPPAEHDDDVQALDVSGLVEDNVSTATPSSVDSANSISTTASAASSPSSIVPPSNADEDSKKKVSSLDVKQHEAFRARLSVKLDLMRAARKADGLDGRPARNRAELIEARRKKEADRKAAKKASRLLAKDDEARAKAEAELARLRGGSGSPSLFSMRTTPEQDHNLAFGRIAWKDGQQLERNLSGFLEQKKKKGPSDLKTALEAAQKKKSRVNGLDEEKRKDIQEKDLWLAAKKRAQGEKVHDDAALLRKSVKRKEQEKAKSSREWTDRLTGVQKSKEAKQKKREENLKKRRDEKKTGKGKKAKKVPKPGKKVQRRAGFEGTFKAR